MEECFLRDLLGLGNAPELHCEFSGHRPHQTTRPPTLLGGVGVGGLHR